MWQNLSSAAVVIGALRVKVCVFEDEIVTLFDVLSVKSKELQEHLDSNHRQ